MSDFYPTKRATKGYVEVWGKRLNDSPALDKIKKRGSFD